MKVYFVPVGADQFAPYFEHPDDDQDPEAAAGAGFFARMRARFSEMIREAERERHKAEPATGGGMLTRAQRRMFRWIAERVAEQRLLWQLRRTEAATLYVPDDMDEAEAERLFRQELQRDGDRHLRNVALHLLGLALSAPLFVVPGPNIVGYFFTFTVIGHFLSFRGARRGVSAVQWTVVPSKALSDLRGALGLDGRERHLRIHEVAKRLQLQRLASFVERMAATTA